MGSGGRRQRPLSFYSTDIENPKRAHVTGCVTQMLLVLGCVLTFGSASVIIQGMNHDQPSIMYIGFVMIAVGLFTLISAFVVCGKVLKHSCCHPGKPTLGQQQMQAFLANGPNTMQFAQVAVIQQPNAGTQPYNPQVPPLLFPGCTQPSAMPQRADIRQANAGAGPYNQPVQPPPFPGYSQPPAMQYSDPPPAYEAVAGQYTPQHTQPFGMEGGTRQDENKESAH